MDVTQPLALLGGLSPRQFARRHWQKRPLLVRQAWPGVQPPLGRAALFALAGDEGVESRVVTQFAPGEWRLRRGPLPRRALPALRRPHWTLLVQGLDLHDEAAHQMLARFRFVPEARLDDLMVSWASDGGGVGPHLDAYDVFLLQVQGRRRWRVGRVRDHGFVDGLPVKILRRFEPEAEWLLEPGDMLYLPPRWGHDGIAEGECMTCSIGFRAPSAAELARELLPRLADEEDGASPLYRDPAGSATAAPGLVPSALRGFARHAVAQALARPGALDRALGEMLTEPKPQVWFEGVEGEAGAPRASPQGLRLDRRTRMMYDERFVFINGESFRAGGRDAALMRRLADARRLPAREAARLGADAQALVAEWRLAGWLHDDE